MLPSGLPLVFFVKGDLIKKWCSKRCLINSHGSITRCADSPSHLLFGNSKWPPIHSIWPTYHYGIISLNEEAHSTHSNPMLLSSLQLSLLSEVRSQVAPQELELYDGLVLHREREALKAWHGGMGSLHPVHPYSRCLHAEPSASHSHSNPTTLCSTKVGGTV
jgi:hypothetical protein